MEAISLNNLHRNTQNIRNAHRAHLAEQSGESNTPMELDPMHLGDVNNNYSVLPTKQNGALKTATLIGLGLLLGPAGAYYAGPIVDALLNRPATEQLDRNVIDDVPEKTNPASTDYTDNDTLYELDIVVGDSPENSKPTNNEGNDKQ